MTWRNIRIFNCILDLEEEVVDTKKIGILNSIGAILLYILISALLFLASFIGSTLFYSLFGKNILNIKGYGIMPFIIQFIIALLSIFILYKTFTFRTHRSFLTKKFSYIDLLSVFLIILGFRLFFDGSLNHITSHLPVPKFIEESFDSLFGNTTSAILITILAAPLEEEFLYRGIILNGLCKKYSPKIALIISSLVFAVAHLNLPQGINAFLLGLLLGYFYIKTKSIILCMFCHGINNLIAILPIWFVDDLSRDYMILFSLIFTTCGIYLMKIGFEIMSLDNRDGI
ncbi:hypothetical protein CPJCM30710_19910 [Clostridium polyendosporum]|uniref:CAAX prenyl protease 2/Lysostaphin resistance protein A-like domain-containing protein n=1 Tax=Clostridium polyendosporum TaxID=69208 RepID=A0A919VGF2_9CLOT|nr:type II CAAX endopeptidase family protein [Clostridium polyendosporum]GIM29325.1 hypothetical protein CPJCM30710_19910 [Clostridium polyendosporum]